MSKPNSATWVLEADIAGCYDNISKQWLLNNIPMERRILKEWLNAGYIKNKKRYPTRKGTPQGGIISPTLANMTLDGLEKEIKSSIPRRNRVNFVRYADDFIVTSKSKQILEKTVIPTVEKFLFKRGLTLSMEKSKITYIKDGFTFLGQSFRRNKGKLNITPAKSGTLYLIRKLRKTIQKYVGSSMEGLIRELNQMLRGWANYHRHVISGKAFEYVDKYVYDELWRMLRRRHGDKSVTWLIKKYWHKHLSWTFYTVSKETKKEYHLFKTKSVGILRHRKIKADANPYLKEYINYFTFRSKDKDNRFRTRMSTRQLRNTMKKKMPGYFNKVTLQNA